MAAPNLTREQAEARAGMLEVNSYEVELDLTDGSGGAGERTFASRTVITFEAKQPGAATFVDLIADTVHKATLNDTPLDLAGYTEQDGLALPELAEHNVLVVEADCDYMNTGEGLHRFVDPVDGGVYLYSQFETADAKRMFACFDQPDLKADFTISVLAPAGWTVISNGAAGEPQQAGDGARRHGFATTERISTYLVALVAGPYAAWHDEFSADGETIPLGIYCRASLAQHMDPERLFTETKQGFGFYHKAFRTPYPFGKYDQCFVPEFNAGAMENVGCVTFLEDYVFRSKVTRAHYERRAETILHEMAHMWFGDLVTMRWWDDLWLNESFATWASIFSQAQATQYTEAWTSFASVEKSWAYRQDQLPSTHPIAADIEDLQAVEVNFDGITYAKGASVLKQLVAYVGEQNFLDGLKLYFDKHSFANATLSDLLGALEQSSGRDLSDWSAQWLQTTGLNLLRPAFTLNADGTFATFAVRQGGAHPGAGELRDHRIAVGIYDDDPATGKLVRVNRVELDVSGDTTDVPELIGASRGKLILVNDDDLTYCSTRLDADSLVTLIDRIGDVAESLPRVLCWSAAWEMTREAELKARDFANLVLGGIAAETEIGVVQRLLLQAQTAISSYSDPDWRATGWRLFAARMLELATAATPGSDHQLSYVSSLAGSVLGEPELAAISGWFDGSAPLAGLVVDADLRWRLVQALVAHGKADEEQIAAELTADDTATGRRHAARARSLVPTVSNKQRAWQQAVHDDELPNAINESIIMGFAHPAQRELLGEFGERYFAEVDEMWERRSSERAQPTAVGLFPSWSVSRDTVARADQWLAGEHNSSLRRMVSEGRAGVVRALAAQQFDRS